jgi:hypothetical protein
MTVLRFGVTPKMKPVSLKRAAVVAGLDLSRKRRKTSSVVAATVFVCWRSLTLRPRE